jgi:hypothetical protein
MDKQKIKLIIRNMELLLDSLKVELYSESNIFEQKNTKNNNDLFFDDYDEIYDEYDGSTN